jgi:hypothetical protein
MSDDQLEALLRSVEEELNHPNVRGQVRRQLDEVVWEIERRESAHRTRLRRQANIAAQHDINQPDADPGPPVFVQGRPLDGRELRDLDARILWTITRERRQRP